MRLEQNLPHQTNAINAVLHVFDGIEPKFYTERTKCPSLTEDIATIKANIAQIQNGEKTNCFANGYTVPENLRQNYTDSTSKYLNIDIKMETGTGKTYVYTKTMFELHRAYGINKFIVLVPTVPIKEGAKDMNVIETICCWLLWALGTRAAGTKGILPMMTGFVIKWQRS